MVLAKEKYGLRGRDLAAHEAQFVPFTAQTRMSGVNLDGREIRKGAADAIFEIHFRGERQWPPARGAGDGANRSRAPAARRWSLRKIAARWA